MMRTSESGHQGMSLLHATCVAIAGVGVLIRGKPGLGKSDLALRLIDGGAELVSDDCCEASVRNGKLIVRAPANIAGKLEVRGYGIVKMPARPETAVGLVVDLARHEDIERLPESATCDIEGVSIPLLALDPFAASAAAKVRVALSSPRVAS